MKALVVYDSKYGNTEKVAKAIVTALGKDEDVKLAKTDSVTGNDMSALDLLIVGSPVQAWKPSKAVRGFLSNLKSKKLPGVQAAAFDTKFSSKLAGSAAKSIANALEKSGCSIIVKPESFFVKGMEGPLSEGELEKAAAWAGRILEKAG